MTMTKHAQVGLFIFTITASGLAMADCPGAMPLQLLEDCIVYEDAGHGFPTSDYAHMDLYNNWMEAQQTEQAKAIARAEVK